LDARVESLLTRLDLPRDSLTALGAGLISLDAEGRVRWLSPLVQELAGRGIGEVVGSPIDVLFQACEPSAQPGSSASGRNKAEASGVRSKPGPDVQTGLLLTRSGTSRSVHHASVPVRDAEGTRPFSVVYMEVDQFKLVNSCGHDGADRMLQWIAAMIRETLRGSDFAARLGRDEFVMLFEGPSPQRALDAVESLQNRLREFRFSWGDKTFSIVASFGVASPGGFESAEDLLSAADHACAVAKERGRDHVQLYERDEAADRATSRGHELGREH
jgi:diguanylate cyclase (GGDEF)-like protein